MNSTPNANRLHIAIFGRCNSGKSSLINALTGQDTALVSAVPGTTTDLVNWLLDMGHIPSFCTACYRAGRTGDRFMSLVKSGQIANCCAPNALMTLKEYLEDYASADTRAKGEVLIQKELKHIPNPKIKEIAARNLKEIIEGKRDFRF